MPAPLPIRSEIWRSTEGKRLHQFTQEGRDRTCKMDPRVHRALEIIDEELAGELSEQVISRSVNLSPARVRQLFKKEVGLSPMRYVKHRRMKTAARLIQPSFLSIKEVIFRSGIRDASHFVRDFKRQYGLTPTEFRLRNHRSLRGSTLIPRLY